MQFAIESWNGRAIAFVRAAASVGVIGICFGGDTGRHPPWLNFLVLEGFTGGGRLRLLGQHQEALRAAAVVAHLLV